MAVHRLQHFPVNIFYKRWTCCYQTNITEIMDAVRSFSYLKISFTQKTFIPSFCSTLHSFPYSSSCPLPNKLELLAKLTTSAMPWHCCRIQVDSKLEYALDSAHYYVLLVVLNEITSESMRQELATEVTQYC